MCRPCINELLLYSLGSKCYSTCLTNSDLYNQLSVWYKKIPATMAFRVQLNLSCPLAEQQSEPPRKCKVNEGQVASNKRASMKTVSLLWPRIFQQNHYFGASELSIRLASVTSQQWCKYSIVGCIRRGFLCRTDLHAVIVKVTDELVKWEWWMTSSNISRYCVALISSTALQITWHLLKTDQI